MIVLSHEEDPRFGIYNVSFPMEARMFVCAMMVDVSKGEGVLGGFGRMGVGGE
jgi:hypothetical protein